MKRFFIHLIILLISSIVAHGQTYLVGHTQRTYLDASRSNRVITAEIYYPSDSTGENVQVSSGQFPVLVFGHGFVMTWSAYENIWSALVPHGYIMVFPTTETSFAPSHLDFGKDMAFLISAMKSEGQNSSSLFYNSIMPSSAVLGHSMGGGSAFLAVEFDSSITAIASLAAAVTNPSSVNAAGRISIPALVISGENDCIAPAAQHQTPMYDSLASNCKSFVSINGASHCQFANYNFFCSTGEATCSPSAAISEAVQHNTTVDVLLPWLNFYLYSSCNDGDDFQNLLNTSTELTSIQNCQLLCNSISHNIEQLKFTISPQPMTDQCSISFSHPIDLAEIKITDQQGRTVRHLNGQSLSGNSLQFKRDGLKAGVYFLEVICKNGSKGIKKMILAD